MKKILVTGCSGYIGSHLVKLLTEKGYEVYGIDKVDPKYEFERFCPLDINHSPSNYIVMNLCDMDITYDAVIHLAALVNVGESEKNPSEYYQTNLNGTSNILRSLRYKNFIFASTGAAQDCKSAYGVSKRAAEDVVKEHCTKSNIPYTTFRFYNVIGSSGFHPTNPDGLMYNLLRMKDTREFTIYGDDYQTVDGTCVRDYVHVDEICLALEMAIRKPSNDIQCLGHGIGHTVKEMVEIFERVNNKYLYPTGQEDLITIKYGPRREGDVPSSVLENVSSYMTTLYGIEELLKVDMLKDS